MDNSQVILRERPPFPSNHVVYHGLWYARRPEVPTTLVQMGEVHRGELLTVVAGNDLQLTYLGPRFVVLDHWVYERCQSLDPNMIDADGATWVTRSAFQNDYFPPDFAAFGAPSTFGVFNAAPTLAGPPSFDSFNGAPAHEAPRLLEQPSYDAVENTPSHELQEHTGAEAKKERRGWSLKESNYLFDLLEQYFAATQREPNGKAWDTIIATFDNRFEGTRIEVGDILVTGTSLRTNRKAFAFAKRSRHNIQSFARDKTMKARYQKLVQRYVVPQDKAPGYKLPKNQYKEDGDDDEFGSGGAMGQGISGGLAWRPRIS